jgi:hypothetical protein
MKRIFFLISVILVIVVILGSCSKVNSENSVSKDTKKDNLSSNNKKKCIARVFGKDIFISDITPNHDELVLAKQAYSKLSDDELLAKVQADKLSSLIISPIIDDFCKTHNVEPTKEEIKSFSKAMNIKIPSESVNGKLKGAADMENEFCISVVKNWKLSKALYKEYGGVVIFQQSNPMEPVGAYRKLLEVNEAKGNFKIYDEKLKQLFWEYYTMNQPFQIPIDQIDYSSPWWLKKNTD